MTWGMRWHHWRKHYHKWALLPKCPSALHNAADHLPNDLYHLSIDKATQCMKIRHAIVSKLEWLYRKEDATSPHIPMHRLVWSLLTCSRMALKNDLQRLWSWHPGRQSHFSDDDCSKRDFLLVMQGMLDSTWVAQLIGLEERLRWKQGWVLSRKVVQPFQMLLWKRELKPVGQDAPKEQWRQTGPPSSIQHQRVDVRLGGKCFRNWSEKWQSK